MQGVVPNNEAVVSLALGEFGQATAIIMCVGMVLYPEQMMANLNKTRGMLFSSKVLHSVGLDNLVCLFTSNTSVDQGKKNH